MEQILAAAAEPEQKTMSTEPTLSTKQQTIPLIASFMAAGDLPKLNSALNEALDAGLTVSEAKEVLVQLYAYVGFPRSLNALGEMMKVLEARKQRGIQDAPGQEPSRAIPTGNELVAVGTANQIKIFGQVVQGPLFDFAPVANLFCRRTCLATSSRVTTSAGKVVSSPRSARWPPRLALNRS